MEFLKRALGARKDAAIFGKIGLSTNDFEIDAKIGGGASGNVYKARPKGGDGVWYALKRFDPAGSPSGPAMPAEVNMARREMEKAAVTQLPSKAKNHCFVVQLFAVIDDPHNKYIGKALVYELCDGDVAMVVKDASDDGRYIPVSRSCCFCLFLLLFCCIALRFSVSLILVLRLISLPRYDVIYRLCCRKPARCSWPRICCARSTSFTATALFTEMCA